MSSLFLWLSNGPLERGTRTNLRVYFCLGGIFKAKGRMVAMSPVRIQGVGPNILSSERLPGFLYSPESKGQLEISSLLKSVEAKKSPGFDFTTS